MLVYYNRKDILFILTGFSAEEAFPFVYNNVFKKKKELVSISSKSNLPNYSHDHPP